MAASFNEITIIGNLGRDVEYKVMNSGAKLAVLSVCTEDLVHLSNGETRKETDWHKVVCWGVLAESVSMLKTGTQVYICGKLKQTKWQDKDGATRYGFEIVAKDAHSTVEDEHEVRESINFSENPYQTNNLSNSITHAA